MHRITKGLYSEFHEISAILYVEMQHLSQGLYIKKNRGNRWTIFRPIQWRSMWRDVAQMEQATALKLASRRLLYLSLSLILFLSLSFLLCRLTLTCSLSIPYDRAFTTIFQRRDVCRPITYISTRVVQERKREKIKERERERETNTIPAIDLLRSNRHWRESAPSCGGWKRERGSRWLSYIVHRKLMQRNTIHDDVNAPKDLSILFKKKYNPRNIAGHPSFTERRWRNGDRKESALSLQMARTSQKNQDWGENEEDELEKHTPSNNLDIHGIEERASGREAVTSATITRTASTATPRCNATLPSQRATAPCAAETPKGPTRQIFVARSCVLYTAAPAGRGSTRDRQ